jgi:hypothetical protein
LAAALARRDGWAVLSPPADLPDRIGRLLWGFASGDGSAGVSSLAPGEVFYPALRRLVDAITVAQAGATPLVVVDATTSGGRLGPFLPAVWPDAVVISATGTDPEAVVSLVDAQRQRHPWPAPGGGQRRGPKARPVVILGAARSGTTWLHRMLSAHPDVAGTETGETWLFPDIAPLWTPDLGAVAGEDHLAAALRDFCDTLLAAMRDRARPGAAYVCEKTPATVWRLPMMARLYPDAYYVHVVRDGRDAALSMAESGFADGDLAAAARTWVDAVARVRGGASELPNFREIRYEDLLAEPARLVAELWDWIGLPATEAATSALADRAGQRVTPLEPVGEIGTGKWRSLDRRRRRKIHAVAGPMLAELGYPTDPA